MKISKVLSTRGSNSKVYSDLIYEWEDDFSERLNIPIITYSNFSEKLRYFSGSLATKLRISGIIQFFDRFFRSDNKTLVFTLYPYQKYNFKTTCNIIPFIIDFDYKVDLNAFYKTYKNCEVIIISSRVAYEYLKEKGCPLNIKHVPLSIKSHLPINRIDFKDRKYDIFIARQNPVLMEYLTKYEKKHPSINYIVRKWEDNKMYSCNAYYSNHEGRLGEFSDRTEYFKLLCNSKVAFYSTTGSDVPDTKFMNHVTPAMLEYISAGCKLLIRWYDTPDSEFFNLSNTFRNARTYEEFESILNSYLASDDNNYELCDNYLKKYGFDRQFEIFKSQLGLK